jgi:hypothetical protein
MVGHEEVREGMTVRDAEGRKLGTVRAVGESHFELEPPGLLSREEFLVEYADVRHVHRGDVFLERVPHLQALEDDDGGALPPRHHERMDGEPVNVAPWPEEDARGP